MTPQYRIEQYLNAINAAYLGDSPLPEYPSEPVWRIEQFLAAILSAAKGDSPVMACPDPVWHIEEFARAIYDALVGASPAWPCPTATNNIETILLAIYNVVADGTETDGIMTSWDIEKWLMDSYDAAKEGGGIEKTVSGTMVHITDALAKAALSVLASIEPIQDLHGYANPWPAGGGKNKVDVVNFDVSTIAGNQKIIFENASSPLVAPFHIHAVYSTVPDKTSGMISVRYTDQTTAVVLYYGQSDVTVTKDVERIVLTNWASATGVIEYLQVESGTSFSSYAPYSNICPISGRTGLSVYRTGKNLYPKCEISGNRNNFVLTHDASTGTYSAQAGTVSAYTQYVSDDTFYLKAGNYYFKMFPSVAVNNVYAQLRSLDGLTTYGSTATEGFTLSSDTIVKPRIIAHANTVIPSGFTFDLMLSVGSATTYEPYNGNTYSVDWTSEAGTVYGGTLDVVTGVLTVDRAMVTLNGSEIWAAHGSIANWFYIDSVVDDSYVKADSNSFAISNKYVQNCYNLRQVFENGQFGIGLPPGGSHNRLVVKDTAYTTVTQFKSALKTSPLQVCYELAAPLTYQLTAQEVQMLLGENYVWASSGDTVSVTYYAEGNANPLQSLNILLGGRYSNPKTADDVSDKEALEIILGGNK